MITKKRKREELQLLRDEALDAYLNREDFQYDVNADALYKQYQDRYTQLGKTAMEDTLGRASALTGGYGSSYAQKVGQQAYQSYLSKADDVIPELYQLAYERYRDESKRLYRNYQAWAQQEQEVAQQERWEQEYALTQQKLRAENARQEGKNSQTLTTVTQPDYWAMLSYHQNLGKSTESKSTATNSTATNSIPDQARYDNGKVSEGNIKTMQRLLGLTDTGKWTALEQEKAGNRSADDAWLDYQQGKLQSRSKAGMSMEEWGKLKNAKTANTPVTMTKTQQTDTFVANTDSWDTVARSGNGYENYEEYLKTRIDSALSKGQLTSGEAAWLISYYTPDIGESMNDKYTSDRFKQLQKQVKAQLAADVDEGFIGSFLMDAQEFVLQTEADVRTLTWTTATSNEAMNERNASAQAIKDRANKVRIWLEANKSQISQDAYQQYIQYLDNFSVFLDQRAETYKKSRVAFSQFATEKDYNKAVARQQWQSKYGTMSFEQIKDILEILPDGDEKEWLKAYAPSVMTAEDYDNEIEEVEAELRTLNAVLEEYDFCRLRYSTADPNSYANVRLNELRQQYGSEEDIENKIEELKAAKWGYENGKKYNLLYLNEDYASESTKVADAPTAGFGINAFDKWYGQGDEVYDYINDIDGSRERIRRGGDKNNGDAGYYHLSFMTKDEIANYNYLYNVSGRKAANEYIAYLKNDLTQRRQAEIAKTHRKLATEHPHWADLYSVGATLASGIGLLDIAGQNAVKGIKEAITGEYAGPINYSSAAMNPNTIATSIRSTRAQNIANKYGVIDINPEDHPFWAKILNGKSFGDVYQLGMSMADSAAVLAMSPILGSYGTVLLGGSAGTQGVITALENGATDEQALAMGVLNGFFEMFFEKYSLETLLSSNGRRFIDALWRQAVAEGSEELFTSAANNVADIIVMAEKSGYMKNVADYISDGFSESDAMQKALLDMGIDMGWEFVGGLISGGIMGGGSKVLTSAKSTIENAEIGKSIMQVDGGVDALMNHANEVAVVNQADVAKSLRSKGVYSKEVEGIAEAITARLNGQELTRTQTSILRSAMDSPTVQSVISDMQKTLTIRSDKVSQKPTARNVGQSDATAQAASNPTSSSINPSDVAESLRGKGIPSHKIETLAEAIVARVNGQQLTKTQRSILNFELGRPTVQNVISNLMSNGKPTVAQLNLKESGFTWQHAKESEKVSQEQSVEAANTYAKTYYDDSKIEWPLPNVPISMEQYRELRTYAESKGVFLQGFKNSDVDISLTKEAIDTAVELLERYPELQGSIRKPFTLYLDRYMRSVDFAEVKEEVPHILHLIADSYRNKRALQTEYGKLADEGWFVRGTSYKSVIYHEMGHMVSDVYGIDGLSVMKKVLGTDSTAETLLWCKNNLSCYSFKSDGSEIISEAFSAFYGTDNPIREIVDFMAICDKMILERRGRR